MAPRFKTRGGRQRMLATLIPHKASFVSTNADLTADHRPPIDWNRLTEIHSVQGRASHLHIQVVTRAEAALTPGKVAEHTSCVPTFPTPSPSPPLHGQQEPVGNMPSRASPQKAPTFADMARGYSEDESMFDAVLDGAVLSRAPFSRYVNESPSRRLLTQKADNTCRARVNDHDTDSNASDLPILEQAMLEASLEASSYSTTGAEDSCDYGTPRSEHQRLPTNDMHIAEQLDTEGAPEQLNRQTKIRGPATIMQEATFNVFGNLPDPIYLHQQPGEFDGQVIFIGHPNRDISAHQWSSTSFQWENIGRYSQSRGKVEGSLASDRMKGRDTSTNSFDPLMCFKLAAKARETYVVNHDRVQADPTALQSASDLPQHTAQSPSDLVASQNVPTQGPVASGHLPDRSTPFRRPMEQEQHGNPFVTNPPPGIKPELANSQGKLGVPSEKGSLDIKYQFPAGPISPDKLIKQVAHSLQTFGNYDVELGTRAVPERVTQAWSSKMRAEQSSPSKFAFDKLAKSNLSSSTVKEVRPNLPTEPRHPIVVPQKPTTSFFGPGEHPNTPSVPIARQNTVPRLSAQPPTARSMYSLPGLTVANPRRTVPTTQTDSPVPAPAIHPPTPEDSHQSDNQIKDVPKRLPRTLQEIIEARRLEALDGTNGLAKYRPTPQNFNGPFFANTTPTTLNPSVPLNAQFNEEDELKYWYPDGKRPKRHQEYIDSLSSMTVNSNKDQTLGAVGEGSSSTPNDQYENNDLWLRVYDVLSEYVGPNKRDDYFTRAWKPAPLHLRDLGPDGNNSFWENDPSEKKKGKERKDES